MTGNRTTGSEAQASPIPSADGGLGAGRATALLVAAVAMSVAASMLATMDRSEPVPPSGSTVEARPSAEPAPAAAAEPATAERLSRDPADVGSPIGDRGPTTVVVELETIEASGRLADGTVYDFWTFDGTVPGPMIRARVGDTVEMTIRNSPDAGNTHSIDLHAVNGPGGGAVVTQVAPGEEKTFSFKALNPGVYVYHCASPHIPSHIANGMYGLIVVEPEGGLPAVDREFYVMQGEIYTVTERGAKGVVEYDGGRMMAEDPTYVVFNGGVNALTGDHPMRANVGETVRMFVGNGGPNKISSFHVIGEIFDRVHDQGAAEAATNVQTTLIPAGGAAWVEFTLEEPGDYVLVDHAITRAVDQGALAILSVAGRHDAAIYDGVFPEPVTEPAEDQAEPAAGDHAPGDRIEVSMTEFAYRPQDLTLPPGTYTFAVSNAGAVPHEWMLSPSGSHTEHVAGTRQLGAGEAHKIEVTLEPGTYEYGCHIPGHYEAGMKGTITVTG